MTKRRVRTRTFWYWTAEYGDDCRTESRLYASESEARDALASCSALYAYNDQDGIMPYRNIALRSVEIASDGSRVEPTLAEAFERRAAELGHDYYAMHNDAEILRLLAANDGEIAYLWFDYVESVERAA